MNNNKYEVSLLLLYQTSPSKKQKVSEVETGKSFKKESEICILFPIREYVKHVKKIM